MNMRPINILLVEDNEGDILLTAEALEEVNITNNLYAVRDGEQALDFLERNPPFANEQLPDLILLDINLPRKNGIEVLKHIKNTRVLRHIPVIILTTSSSESDISRSYDNYANCYITKPSDISDFTHIMKVIEDFWMRIVKLPNLT